MYFIDENGELLTIRNTEPEELLMLLKACCLGNACQPQMLLNILGSEPWLLIKRLLIKNSCMQLMIVLNVLNHGNV